MAESAHGGLLGRLADFAPDQESKAQIIEGEEWIEMENKRKTGTRASDFSPTPLFPTSHSRPSFREDNISELKNEIFRDLLRQSVIEVLGELADKGQTVARKMKFKGPSTESTEPRKEEPVVKRGSELNRSNELHLIRKILGVPFLPSNQQMSTFS